MDKRKYPIRPEDYRLFEEIGDGVTARVYRALCLPLDEVVAVKVLDLEKHNADLGNISRETQTMILVDHPNLLRAHCSFTNDKSLWVIMPYMAAGSFLHILRSAYPDGLEEVVIATILRDVLKGLEYLHSQGHIHRDVKAGNILVDAKSGIKLGDFGVSASLFDSGDRQQKRNTFVGTPCWMAPEVMEQLHGYNCKADIWSFGITALELAHGHAPFSKFPPMKVLLMILQNAPPTLNYERDRKFSKSFKQMIAVCLVKDPSRRPTAHKLLKHQFFKQARSHDYMCRTILETLPPLEDGVKTLKEKEQDKLEHKEMLSGRKEELSQHEYKRALSGWDFDIEELKLQAALVQDEESPSEKDSIASANSVFEIGNILSRTSPSFSSGSCSSREEPEKVNSEENGDTVHTTAAAVSVIGRGSTSKRGKNGVEDDLSVGSTNSEIVYQYDFHGHQDEMDDFSHGSAGSQPDDRPLETLNSHSSHARRGSTSSSLSDVSQSSCKEKSGFNQQKIQKAEIFNGSTSQTTDGLPSVTTPKATKPPADPDSKSKASVVQQKGRFKVTSENNEGQKVPPPLSIPKSQSLQALTQFAGTNLWSPDTKTSTAGSAHYQHLRTFLVDNIQKREYILNAMKQVVAGSANQTAYGELIQLPAFKTEKHMLEVAHEREKELLQEVVDLQSRILRGNDDPQKFKIGKPQV